MHIWAALGCASACMGRHVWYPFGLGPIYGNMYILLVGLPATRKSSAMEIAKRFVTQHTGVNIAPDDTAGQRQGLLTAMGADEQAEKEEAEKAGESLGLTKQDLQSFGWRMNENDIDKHTIFITADEWGSFIGQNNQDLTRFLIRMYNGGDYRYQLKKVTTTLESPLVSMLGCTTPTEIATLLPPEAIGQGFMSRIILVFAHRKHKRVEEPELHTIHLPFLSDTFRWIWHEAKGEMKREDKAREMISEIYKQEVQIHDARFVYYGERRQTVHRESELPV